MASHTCYFKCFAGGGLSPLAIDVADVLLEERRIFELERVSSCQFGGGSEDE
jgi:hypothetical protein